MDFDLMRSNENHDFLITPEYRELLRSLADRATPGPWLVWDDNDVGTAYSVKKKRRRRGHSSEEIEVESEWIANTGPGDGAYIAALDPGTVIGLLDHIDYLEKLIANKN